MQQLTYILRFQGTAQATGPDGNALKIAATVPDGSVTTGTTPDGSGETLQPGFGETASLESELTFTGATTFQETGTIAFGTGGHRLRFSTVGSGHLASATAEGRRFGATIWRVDDGDGQFADASGLIASIFVLDDAGDVTDHQLGVVFLR